MKKLWGKKEYLTFGVSLIKLWMALCSVLVREAVS